MSPYSPATSTNAIYAVDATASPKQASGIPRASTEVSVMRAAAVVSVSFASLWLLGAAPAPTAVAVDDASPIYGVTIPHGYRQWEMIAPSQEAGNLDELRVILGNSLAASAYRANVRPFPDGTILVKLAWKRVASSVFEGAFVPATATTVQVMVKDSARYSASGGWGFGRFIGGKAVDAAQHQHCFACHAARVRASDFVFTKLVQ